VPGTGASTVTGAPKTGARRQCPSRRSAAPASAGSPNAAAERAGESERTGALRVAPSPSSLGQRLEHGLVPAVPVPHRADGSFDAAAQDAYAAWMAGQEIAGVAVWVHTGRGLHLSLETAAAVLSSWRRALPGRIVLAGAGARPRSQPGHPGARVTPPADPLGLTDFVIKSTIEMAIRARDLGADAILAFPPVLLDELEDREGRIVEVHAALKECGLPVIAFCLYEAAGGCRYSHRAFDRILALPHVAGIKVATLDSVITFQDIAARVPPGKLLVTGEDRFLGYSLMMGARCALIGMAAVETALPAALLSAHAGRDHERFFRCSAACDRFGAALFQDPVDGYPRRVLSLLGAQGIIPAEATFDPYGPDVPGWQLKDVERVSRELPKS
jgi:4-hydroxy-tetrahydrodipicolinate synthase